MHLLVKALRHVDNLVITQHTLWRVGHAIQRNVIDCGLFIVQGPRSNQLVTQQNIPLSSNKQSVSLKENPAE